MISNQWILSLDHALAYQYHGKSTITHESFMMKKFNNFVFQGTFEHFARSHLCDSKLISDDFQTLERPKKTNSGKLKSGHWSNSIALLTNLAEVILISNIYKVIINYIYKYIRKNQTKLNRYRQN